VNDAKLEAQIVDREEDLESLCAQWRDLYRVQGQANFFIDPDYLRIWWRHFGQMSTPRVFVFRDRQGLRAVFPFRLTRRRAGPVNLRVMSGMSNWESAKPQWLIRGEVEPVMDSWLDVALARRDWDVFHLPDTPLDTPGLTYLWRRLTARGYKFRDVPCEGATIISVNRDFDYYLATRPKKKRHNMKWALNRIKKAGPVGFEVSRPEDDPGQWIDRLFDLAGRTWQAAEGTGLNQAPRADFYDEVVRTFLPRKGLRILILTLNGKDVAFFLGYLHLGVFYIFKTGYDQEFHQVYPGLVLLKHLLENSFQDDDIQLLDFITSKPLFATWTEATAPMCDLVVYHHTPRGRLLCLVQTAIIPRLKQMGIRPRRSGGQTET
jgi:CelD/BcsL family acetyltransferase involved in cellulose biosynthesis